jgi:hypothetical protein
MEVRSRGENNPAFGDRRRVPLFPPNQQEVVAASNPGRARVLSVLVLLSGTAAAPFIYTLF